jgi:hypothetical protein
MTNLPGNYAPTNAGRTGNSGPTDAAQNRGSAGKRPVKKPRGKGRLAFGADTTNPNVKQVRLTLVFIDFWTALKISFLIGLAQAIVVIIATFLLYLVFVQTGIFDRANSVVGQVVGGNGFDVRSILSMGQAVAFSAVAGVLNMVVITILGAVAAVIYNTIARIVGGVKVGFESD